MTERNRSAILTCKSMKFDHEKQPTMAEKNDEELIDFLANRGLTEEQLIQVEDDNVGV